MNFQVISDLYMDSNRYEKFKMCGNNLIIAGALGKIGEEYTQLIKTFCSYYEKVILVPGVYEYVGREMSETKKYFSSLVVANPNLVVLDNTWVDLGGIVVFGSTFWSHILSEPDLDIIVSGKRIRRMDWNRLHNESILALEKAIEFSKNKPLMVVTHFSPLGEESIHPVYRKQDNKMLFYYSNTVLQNEETIKLWIYGRTGYNFCKGKFISNQLVSGGSFELVVNLK